VGNQPHTSPYGLAYLMFGSKVTLWTPCTLRSAPNPIWKWYGTMFPSSSIRCHTNRTHLPMCF
jgi:hypothetical protein